MKRFLLIASASALLMTSCSEEKFLNDSALEQNANAGNGTIEFQAHQPNQSRANLEEFSSNFGVFGIKVKLDETNKIIKPALPITATTTDLEQLVFNNYLVGHVLTYPVQNGGVTETSSPFTSGWYYEGLGYNEYGCDEGITQSAWEKQYLKYWDASYKYTYFVGYTPYENTNAPILDNYTGENSNDYLFTLKSQTPMTINDHAPTMVAAKQELIEKHVGAANANKKVSLKFIHPQPQIRIAFYEVIKGYKVQMVNVHEDYGVAAMPFNEKADGSYEAGKIDTSKKFVVNVKNEADEDGNLKCEFSYTEPINDKYCFNFNVKNVYLNSPQGTATEFLKEERANKAFSSTVYNVFPQSKDATSTCPLQFVLSFELVAEDTGEVIRVNQARVDIPKTYVDWKENSLYTYIFKITKDTKGTTATPVPFDPETPEKPGDDPALYPIVFDQLTVQDMNPNGNTTEFTLYDAHNPTATDDEAGKFIFKSGAEAKDYAEVMLGHTLNLKTQYFTDEYKTGKTGKFEFKSDNKNIAEVDKTTGVVTGKAQGSTTIHVTYTEEGKKTITDAIIVYVTHQPVFLKDPVWDVQVNTSYKLTDNIASTDDTHAEDITWWIYNRTTGEYDQLNANKTTNEYIYTAAGNAINFKEAGTYMFKAIYTDPTKEATDPNRTKTDFFFIHVANKVLKAFKKTVKAGTACDLTSLVNDDYKANVTWKIFIPDTWTALNTDASEADYSYVAADKALTFAESAANKSYKLQATYTDTAEPPHTETEYITLTVKL